VTSPMMSKPPVPSGVVCKVSTFYLNRWSTLGL
jgi:hypothetical protein